jgi:hypothetical protein
MHRRASREKKNKNDNKGFLESPDHGGYSILIRRNFQGELARTRRFFLAEDPGIREAHIMQR